MRTQTATLQMNARWPHAMTACSLCGHDLKSSGRIGQTLEERLAEHVSRVHILPEVGDFVSYTMVTDTRTFEVVKTTAKTITLRDMVDGEILKREDRDGSGWPQVYTEQVSSEGMPETTVRLRKDGTYRVASYAVLRPATMIDGKPVRYTDYRM